MSLNPLDMLKQLGLEGLPMLQQFKLLSYGTLVASDVTAAHIREVCNVVGWNMSDENCSVLAQAISSNSSETLGAWLSSPPNFEHVKQLIASSMAPQTDLVAQCPFCSSTFLVHSENAYTDEAHGAEEPITYVRCPMCGATFI